MLPGTVWESWAFCCQVQGRVCRWAVGLGVIWQLVAAVGSSPRCRVPGAFVAAAPARRGWSSHALAGARRRLVGAEGVGTYGPPWAFCAGPVLLLESCAAKQRDFGSQQPVQLGERWDLLRLYSFKSPGLHSANSPPGQSVTSRTTGGIPVKSNSWTLVASSTAHKAPTCSVVLMA